MIVKFDVSINDLDGNPAKVDNSDEILTMRKVSIIALTSISNKNTLTGEEKFRNATLAQKINDCDSLDLSIEEAKNLKDVIGDFWSPIVVMSAWNIINPPADTSLNGK